MKLSKDEFDAKALDVKVEKSTFRRYRGEIPRNGTILIFRVTRMWWTQAKDGTSQIYLMAFAEQNKGDDKQYNGLPVREYLTFKPEAAFRYQNFLQNFGLTTKDIFNKMDVEPEPDSIGDVITAIGGWVVGSDDALCRIALVRDRYDPDELKAKVDRDGWMPLDEDDEVDEDDDDDDDEDNEEEEQPARPARRSRTAAKPAAKSRRRAEPEPEEDDDDEDDEDEDEDEDDIDAEEEGQEEEDQEDDDDEEDADDEPPARTRRSRDTGRAAARTRPAASGRRGAATSGRRDGERTRSGSRTSTARTERTPGPRGSKGRDGGSREDPPF
jgi:hypothetical protein